MQIDRIPLRFAAGESASEAFELARHNISALQRRGLVAYVASITLPDDWTPATLLYDVCYDGERWQLLSDLRGLISAPARPGMVLTSTAEIWRGVCWIRLRSEPPQRADVAVELGIGAIASGANFARPLEMTR